jgi:hypothetical protein
MRAVIPVVLFMTIAIQAGCYTRTAGPTSPVAPSDSAAVRLIEEAGRIEVVTMAGAKYTIDAPRISGQTLTGRAISRTQRGTFHSATIPLDSIAQIQFVRLSVLRTTAAVLGVVIPVVGAFIISETGLPII